MREIKFKRAHFFDEELTEFSHFTIWGVGIEDTVFTLASFYNEAIYFIDYQYTGVKDENNQEIYEGDILKCEVGNNEIVQFRKAGFVCRYRTISLFELWVNQRIEVIGNVNENSELLS